MNRLSRWGPVICWMVVIFYFSARTRVSVSADNLLNFIFFKSLHLAEYAILFGLNLRALGLSGIKTELSKSALPAFFLTVIYAITDEIHQAFVPTREGRPRDVIIDAIGAGIAWIIIRFILPKTPGKLRKLAGSSEPLSFGK